MRNDARVKLFSQYLHEGFEDDDDLDFYLKEFVGLYIPRIAFCPHHDAPFDFLADVYFERVLYALAFGSRSSGKTTLVSVLNHLDTMYKGKVDITSAGSTLDQSGKGYKYFQNTFEDPLLKPYLLNSIQSHSETWNGSTLDIVAGTMKGLNGPHPQKARFDEVELMDWNVLQEGLSMSVSNRRVQAQDTLSCVTGDTLIDIPRNLRKYPYGVPIKKLVGKKGWVYTYDVNTHSIVLRPYAKVWRTKSDLVYRVSFEYYTRTVYGMELHKGYLEATGDHPVMIDEAQYRNIFELRPGDVLISVKGSNCSVNSVEPSGYKHVYDMEVPSTNNFIANGIIVHNSTRKKTHGVMNRLLREAEEKKMRVYNFCLSGDTIIRSPLGDKPIESLVGKKSHLVYSIKDGKLVLRKAKHIRKTRENTSVLRLTYKWRSRGGYKFGQLVATPDHEIMLRNGTYRRMDELRVGDSLMPFVTWTNKHPRKYKETYRQRMVGIDFESAQIESRFVWEQRYGAILEGYVVHHKDGNSLHNRPSNLELKLRTDHSKEHTEQWWDAAPEEHIRNRNGKISQKAAVYNTSEKGIRANKIRWDAMTDEDGRQHRIKANPWKDLSDEEYAARCKAISEGKKKSLSNHEVVSVEPFGNQDVYCMEVPGTHNFIANDICVSNCIWDVVEKCTRQCHDDPEYGNCPIYDKCQGKAHNGNGWFSVDDLIKKVMVLSVDTFQTQWENLRPSDAPTVYGDYWNEDMHVLSWHRGGQYKSFSEVFGENDIPDDWRRIGGIDFGSRFCFLMTAIEPRRDIWVVYHEYWCDYDRLLKDHASHIKSSPGYRPRMPIFADPAGKQDRIELRKHGIRTWGAIKDIDLGVDAVKQKLQKNPVDGLPRLFVMAKCKRLIYEFSSWAHGTHDDGTVDRDVFLDYDDDASDTLRYQVFSYRRVRPTSRVTTLDGV